MPRLKMIRSFVFCAGLGLALTACPGGVPKTRSEAPPAVETKTIVATGDPNDLLKGARTELRGPFMASSFTALADYSLTSYLTIVEKQDASKTGEPTRQDLEKEQQTEKKAADDAITRVTVDRAGEGRWTVGLLDGRLKIDFLTDPTGHPQPYRGRSAESEIALEPVHWSATPDGRFVSLLMRTRTPESGRVLLALHFERRGPRVAVKTTSSEFLYLMGPGMKYAWPVVPGRPLTVDLCGAPEMAQTVQWALERWQKVLGDRLPIRFRASADYAPFTDLNQHCVYFSDTYLADARESVGNYGSTYSMKSLTYARFIDADVFIYKPELRKILKAPGEATETQRREAMARALRLTLVHELGHFLGLDHQFNGTPSVMSYEFNQDGPSDYDVRAVRALYESEPPAAKTAE